MRRGLVIAIAAVALACDENPLAPSEIVGRTWQLVSFQQDGSDAVAIADPSRYTLRFEEGGRAAVRSDCNSCGGSYSLSGASLELAAIACTRVACGTASVDPRFVRALEGTNTVSVSDSDMTLRGNGFTLRFRN